ncbi:HAMP domain-containing protein [Deinococcus humi]|uniref:HAMP domain-containing protein n=1 Tax=Deinococcus humi TaxID=662880 RepID=A0A7W8JRE8_9DEIO|nr:HAMP domain-containing protein [Deinococcus humi]MBB5361837.1 HAMP domain-containing protein [Deinococcus humi]GGO23397.1 HAMP domain-containing protein [Deinococcus humi]
MKYTVTIQQPVQEERRRGLEQQLTERFNLSAEQAARLASRRTGRLMKPTSRSRAELLLDVFQLMGAAVALEEVPEETRMMQEPFQGVAPSASASPFGRSEPQDEAFLAPLLPAPAWPGTPEASTDHAIPAPFTSDPLSVTAFGAAPGAFSGGGAVVAIPTAAVPAVAPGDPFASPSTDVWSDFTGSLTLTDAVSAETVSSGADQPVPTAVVPVVIPAVAAEAGPSTPRRSLTRLLTLNTMAPLALSSVVALGLLAVTLPAVQRQVAQAQAQTLAVAVAAGMGSSAQLSVQQVNAQLGAVVAAPGVAFVRAELPSGQTTLRAQDAGVGQQTKELLAWLGSHPSGGTLKLGGSQYVVAQAVFRKTAAGKIEVVPAGAAAEAGALRRVAVGVPGRQAGAVLNTALLLVLLAAVLGLFLASLLTRRSARQITDPIDRLVKAADAISMGDLSRPVHSDHNDEIGDLAQALERMRQSLEAAMDRLRRRRKG